MTGGWEDSPRGAVGSIDLYVILHLRPPTASRIDSTVYFFGSVHLSCRALTLVEGPPETGRATAQCLV